MATLGLALIAKNNEDTLPQLLESIKGMVDQIVLVDTGSTDKTIEIAKSYGAEIHHFKWINDFSAARNESFGHITTDYILWLDTDDIVYPEDAERIKKLMENPQHDQYLFIYDYAHDEYKNPIMSFFRERISKRSLGLKWNDPIHEYLPMASNYKECPDIHIHHFKTAENAAGTFERNTKILEDEVKKNPANARVQFYLAKEYGDAGHADKAEKEYLKYLEMPTGWIENRFSAYQKLAEIERDRKNYDKALAYLNDCTKINPDRAEVLCLYGEIYNAKGETKTAIHYYEKATFEASKNNLGFNSVPYSTWIPNLQLCVLYNQLGDIWKAYEHNEIALSYKPNEQTMLNNKKILETAIKDKPKPEKKDLLSFIVPYGDSEGYDPLYALVETLKKQGINSQILFYLWGPYLADRPTEPPKPTKVPFRLIDKISKADLRDSTHVVSCEWWLNIFINDYTATEIIKSYYMMGDPYAIWPNQAEDITAALRLPLNKLASNLENKKVFETKTNSLIGILNEKTAGEVFSNMEKIEKLKNTQLKIGWLCPVNKDFGPIRLRAHNIDKWLRSVGIDSLFLIPLDPDTVECDVYIASHHYNLEHFKKVKQKGKPLILDIAEDLFELVPGYKEAVAAADFVTCCSTELTKRASQYNSNVITIKDSIEVPLGLSPQHSSKTGGLKIGWMGYQNNFQWVKELQPLIKNLGHELIAVHEGNEKLADQDIKWSPTFYETLQQCDILIAPVNVELQGAKSDNKLATYLALGKPVICGPMPSYIELQKDSSDFIVARSVEEWERAFEALRDPSLRKTLGLKGLNYNENSINKIGISWVEFLSQFSKTTESQPTEKIVVGDTQEDIKLNIGCGPFKFPGFINIDIDPEYMPDIIGDATNLKEFNDDSISFIFSGHTLEHLKNPEDALQEFYRILKPGGRIELILPDSDKVARAYSAGECDFDTLAQWTIASDGDHKVLFSQEKLLQMVQKAGYEKVESFNLNGYPWVVVPDINNPVPEPYHCTARGYKPGSSLKLTKPLNLDSKKVDIIIPTTEGNEEYLYECIKSVRENTEHPYAITVIKSNVKNPEKFDSELEELKLDDLIYDDDLLTFSQACNEAIKESDYPLVLILNDDTIVSKGWLRGMVDCLDDKTRIVGPFSNCDFGWQHQHVIQTQNLTLVPNMQLDQVEKHLSEIYSYKPSFNERKAERDWVAFYATLFDRALFEELEYLDEGFENGGEDVDFCNKARKAGYKVAYCYDSFVFHFGQISRGKNLEEFDKKNLNRLENKQKSVVFYTGPAWEKWAPPMIETTGLGGSETMAAKIAEELHKLGFNVKVFNDCRDLAGDYNGVEYIHHEKFGEYVANNEMDVFVSSRVPWIFGLDIKSKANLCWVHDIWLAQDPNTYIGQDKVDKYLVLSPWHQKFFSDHHKISTDQTHLMRNGISLERFKESPKRNKNRIIYSSSPDRGLDVLLQLFPQMRAKYPDLELHVFYGFDNWNKSIEKSGDANQKRWRDQIMEMLKQPGVISRGRIGQKDLAKEFGKSWAWTYPSMFTETFCITALESMAAGTPCLCSDYAGLQSTAGEAACLVFKKRFQHGDNYTPEYQKEFLEKFDRLMTDEQYWEKYHKLGLEKVKHFTYEKVAQSWYELINNLLENK